MLSELTENKHIKEAKNLYKNQIQWLYNHGSLALLCFIMCLFQSCQPEIKSDKCCIEVSFNKANYCLYFQEPEIRYPVYRVYYSQPYLEAPNVDSVVFRIILQSEYLDFFNLTIYVQDSCKSQLDKENMNSTFIEWIMARDNIATEETTMSTHYIDENRFGWTYTRIDSMWDFESSSYYHFIQPLDSCRRLFISMKEQYVPPFRDEITGYDTIYCKLIESLEIKPGKCRHCETGCYKTFHPNFQ
jgi:hypothetical protein